MVLKIVKNRIHFWGVQPSSYHLARDLGGGAERSSDVTSKRVSAAEQHQHGGNSVVVLVYDAEFRPQQQSVTGRRGGSPGTTATRGKPRLDRGEKRWSSWGFDGEACYRWRRRG
eukprot:7348505-Pyramimonas_sp.AAC.1